MKKDTGSILVEILIALTIGIIVLLQLTSWIIFFVQQFHGLAEKERRMLHEAIVLDLLIQDLAPAVELHALDGGAGVMLAFWRLRAPKAQPKLITISWKKIGKQLFRYVEGLSSPQGFGDLLKELDIDCIERGIHFVGEDKKRHAYAF